MKYAMELTVAAFEGGDSGCKLWTGPAGADVGWCRASVQRQVPAGVRQVLEHRCRVVARWKQKNILVLGSNQRPSIYID
jgi:hypothetical protein